jgi:hypothetical protein
MKNLYVDKNSRAVQCSIIGYGKNFSVGEITDSEVHGFIRVKNIGEDMAIFRYSNYKDSDGIYLSPGETEYFFVDDDHSIEIVQGTLNIMY